MTQGSRSHGLQSRLQGLSSAGQSETGQGAGQRTHEEVVCVWNIATNSKELHKIVKLAMDISAYLSNVSILPLVVFFCHATYCDGRRHRHDVPLLDEKLPRLVAELAHLCLGNRPACAQLRDRPGEKQSVLGRVWWRQ